MGRLFYWMLTVAAISSIAFGGVSEEPSGGKPATSPTAKLGAAKVLRGATSPALQSGPVLTSVVDTVYLADGSAAQGVLIITWPAFVTAGGAAVAPGVLNVTLGTGGALNVALEPNAGASPAGVYFTVVYQLEPGEVRTEYWVVPTISPATLAEVRTTPGSGTAAAPASEQYVNTALAGKANDNAVVHLAGTETVTGTKSFSVPPNVPTPLGTGDVANKSYVDSSVASVGAGNYLATAGGTMTGSLTLSGNPASLVASATVLYDDVITDAPGFCNYSLVNAANMQCSIAYTYVSHISLAEVRMALPAESYVTQLVGSISEGAECDITSSASLDFYPAYVPALNELIVASYRGTGRAMAQVQNAASVAALQNGADDGTRGTVVVAKTPGARTEVDCENAALAILDDAVGVAWSGTYETWSDFLPGGAADVFPGDAITVSVPSRSAAFTAVVREVEITVADPADDRGFYEIGFANDLAALLAIEYAASATVIPMQQMPPLLLTSQVGSYYQINLTEAQITAATSTTVEVDAGISPASGVGIEVRENDFGWGQANDRNLLGRFTTQTFSLPRLTRTQNYFLRLYDSSSPPHYSRYSAALHIDIPLGGSFG
jgi:hypothetical protein